MNNDLEQLVEFSKLFDYEHDNERDIVIVGCAFIEELIKETLRESLIQDDEEITKLISESTGSLPGLIQRARLLYLLGVIPKLVFEDLKYIAKIRNHFAHNMQASFSDNKVAQLCRNLKWHIESMMCLPPEGATTRDLYQVGVNQIVCHLNALPALARYKRMHLTNSS
ncbi:MltR family transcriptional regulator [Chlorobium limicola]